MYAESKLILNGQFNSVFYYIPLSFQLDWHGKGFELFHGNWFLYTKSSNVLDQDSADWASCPICTMRIEQIAERSQASFSKSVKWRICTWFLSPLRILMFIFESVYNGSIIMFNFTER